MPKRKQSTLGSEIVHEPSPHLKHIILNATECDALQRELKIVSNLLPKPQPELPQLARLYLRLTN